MEGRHDTVEWAAGLFEGEGYFTRQVIGRRVYLLAGIEMRDRDVVERFITVMQGNGVLPEERASGPKVIAALRIREKSKNNPKHSDTYVWSTTGNTARIAFGLMRPFLGERRSARGAEIIAEADRVNEALQAPVPCKLCGGPFSRSPHGHNRQFCSSLCHTRWKIEQPGQRERARERQRRYKQRCRDKAALISAENRREK